MIIARVGYSCHLRIIDGDHSIFGDLALLFESRSHTVQCAGLERLDAYGILVRIAVASSARTLTPRSGETSLSVPLEACILSI